MNNSELIFPTFDESIIPTMLTIKELAERTNLSYTFIRKLCKEKKIVHIKSGTKYLINYEKFIEYLNTGIS